LYLKLNNHLKEVKETSVDDSTAERVDLGMERERSVSYVNSSVWGRTSREFKSIRAVSSCKQKLLRY